MNIKMEVEPVFSLFMASKATEITAKSRVAAEFSITLASIIIHSQVDPNF